jgi:hypothetical protein
MDGAHLAFLFLKSETPPSSSILTPADGRASTNHGGELGWSIRCEYRVSVEVP